MSCVICSRVNESVAFSLLGSAICRDCEAWLLLVSPEQPEYDSAVRVFKDVWSSYLAGRSLNDVVQENLVGD